MIKTNVIMRAYNDMPLISETLASLSRQKSQFNLIAFDNESFDGTVQELEKYAGKIITVPKGTYVPGKVLNHAMRESEGEFVVFLNSDCTPQNEFWLENLLKGFNDEKVAAVFGKQVPREDCQPLLAKDIDDTYGDGERQKLWKHCFSMASSAIRRSVWEEMPFNEDIQYSEDIEWTWRARQNGYKINYVPDSVVAHSHNYTLKQFYWRHYGEGKAEAAFFEWKNWERSIIRYSLMPYVRQVISDVKFCFLTFDPISFFYSFLLRGSQMLGRRKGFKEQIKKESQK